jgi:5-methylthioadenosine/S-adenosylhomocysteine deaminase
MEADDIDLLISGAEILTFDDAGTVLRNGAVASAGNAIVWIGKCREAARERFDEAIG